MKKGKFGKPLLDSWCFISGVSRKEGEFTSKKRRTFEKIRKRKAKEIEKRKE